MSLDFLGKVSSDSQHQPFLHQQMAEFASQLNLGVVLDSLDPDDEAVLEELNPTSEKFYFSINSSADEYDATELWNEAYILARGILHKSIGKEAMEISNSLENVVWPDTYIEEMRSCRLARFIHAIAGMQHYQSISVALVDGGVDSEFKGTADECIEQILKTVLLAWDNSPNTLYTWKNPR